MSSAKKRKKGFQKEWSDIFFFIEERGKPFCLKCKGHQQL